MAQPYEYLSAVAIPPGGCSRCAGEYNLLNLGITGNPFTLGMVTLCGTCIGELVEALGMIPETRAKAENEALGEQVLALGAQLRNAETELQIARSTGIFPTDDIIEEFTDGINALADRASARVRDAAPARGVAAPTLVDAPAVEQPSAADERVPDPADEVDGGGDEDDEFGDDVVVAEPIGSADVFAFLRNLGVDDAGVSAVDGAGVEGSDGVSGDLGGELNRDS